jgi:hypothetical protein
MTAAMLGELIPFLDNIPDHMKVWFPKRAVLIQHQTQMQALAHESSGISHTYSVREMRMDGDYCD